jgi:lactate dehydrogenase-like 2-hydroxyacid dehydrogenase
MASSGADRGGGRYCRAEAGRALAAILERFGAEAYTTNAEALLAEADVVSLHLPPAKDGRPFLDRARLGRMKQGAFLSGRFEEMNRVDGNA